MKKISRLLGIGLSAMVLALTLPPAGAAQQAGDSFVILLPQATQAALPSGRGAGPWRLVVTSGPKAATKVGTCKAGDFRAQEVNIVNAEGTVLGKGEVILVDWGYQNEGAQAFTGIALPVGTRLGSVRGGGACGPGYGGYTGHIYQGDAGP